MTGQMVGGGRISEDSVYVHVCVCVCSDRIRDLITKKDDVYFVWPMTMEEERKTQYGS